LQATPF
jgi:hypothetical protein